MKKSIIISGIMVLAMCAGASAQTVAPPGAGDRDLQDRNVKNRSIDLERVKRDNDVKDKDDPEKKVVTAKGETAAKTEAELKFPEIKEDYEELQKLQDSIIKAYQPPGKIDYKTIAESSADIQKRAIRLSANLFPKKEESISGVKTAEVKVEEKPAESSKTLRELIVELDNSMASFVTSPVFQTAQPDLKESEKAQAELENIKKYSELVSKKAGEKL